MAPIDVPRAVGNIRQVHPNGPFRGSPDVPKKTMVPLCTVVLLTERCSARAAGRRRPGRSRGRTSCVSSVWLFAESSPVRLAMRWSLIIGTVVPTALALLELGRRALGVRLPPPGRDLARIAALAAGPAPPAVILDQVGAELRLLHARGRGLPDVLAAVQDATRSQHGPEVHGAIEQLQRDLTAARATSDRWVRRASWTGVALALLTVVGVALLLAATGTWS